jgi:hypothetical protein
MSSDGSDEGITFIGNWNSTQNSIIESIDNYYCTVFSKLNLMNHQIMMFSIDMHYTYRILQNIEYYSIQNIAEYRILQNTEYCRI